jgi:hypothetical protein
LKKRYGLIMSTRTPSPPSRFHPVLICLMPVLAAFVLALAGPWLFTRGHLLFEQESVHLFQAHTLKSGQLRQAYPAVAPWLSDSGLILNRDAGWFAPVPPGHALWLIPGLWINFPYLMSALAAAGSVWFMTLIGLRMRFPPLLLPLLMLASPFFVFLHGTLMPQTLEMLLCTVFMWAYLRMTQSPGTGGGALCGLAWGLLYLVNPWNAALLAIPFFPHWLSILAHNRKSAAPWVRTLMFFIGLLPGVLLLTGYFRELSLNSGGLARDILQHRVHGWLPFQDGSTTPASDPHSMRRGLSLLWRHVRLMDQWLFGTPRFTLLLWLGLAGHGWNRRWSPLFLGVSVVMFFGYVTWPQLDSTIGGPRYQAPMLPFFIFFGAMGLNQIWRKLDSLPSVRKFLFLFLGLWGVLSSVEFLREKQSEIDEHYASFFQVQKALSALDQPVLLFYQDPFPDDRPQRSLFGANLRALDSEIFRLRAPLQQQAGIRDTFPGRYAVVLDDESLELIPFTGTFEDRERAGFDAHHAPGTGRNTEDGRVASSADHSPGYLFYGWYPFLPPGRYEVRFDLRWEQIRADAPTRLEVVSDFGLNILASTEITGGLTSTTLDFSVAEGQQIEPRVVFGGSGTVHLRRVILRRLGPLEPQPASSL